MNREPSSLQEWSKFFSSGFRPNDHVSGMCSVLDKSCHSPDESLNESTYSAGCGILETLSTGTIFGPIIRSPFCGFHFYLNEKYNKDISTTLVLYPRIHLCSIFLTIRPLTFNFAKAIFSVIFFIMEILAHLIFTCKMI